MRHNIARIRVPEEIHRRRLAALDELLAGVEVRMVDAEEGLAIVERSTKPAALRRCREDLAAAEARREVLEVVRVMVKRAALAGRSEAAWHGP